MRTFGFLFLRGTFVLLVSLISFNSAQAWWDGNWKTRATLTFDNSGQPENLVDFPVLVVLDGTRIDYGKVQDLGEDLRFIDSDDVTPLDYEIDVWNELGTSFVWVKVPQIDASSNSDFIYIYYDHGTAADGQDRTAVWSNGYAAVWHLDEDPTGANPVEDSSANLMHGVPSPSMDATNVATGRVGNGLDFDGASDYVRVASTAADSLAITGTALTIESWAKRNGDTPGNVWMVLVGRQHGAGSADSYVTALKFNDPSVGVFNTLAGGSVETSSGEVPDGQWHYLAGVQDAANITIFSNGVQVNQLASGGPIQTDLNDVIIAGQENAADSTVDTNFVGVLDEIRISRVSRTSRWLAAQHLSMTDSLITYGTATTTVADLSLVKTVDDLTPNVGSNVVFTLAIANGGPSTATGVEVSDVLLAGFDYVSDNGGGSYLPGSGVWTVGSLGVGAPDTLVITTNVKASGPYANTAEVTAVVQPDPDSVPGNGIPSEDDQSTVTLTPELLGIVKRAYLLDGTPISHNSTLPKGALIRYLLYINNPRGSMADVSLVDALDPGFLFVPGTMRFDNSVGACAADTCDAAEEALIFAAVDAGTVGTDALDGDVVSFQAATVNVGDAAVANGQLDLAANRVWAVLFTVKID